MTNKLGTAIKEPQTSKNLEKRSLITGGSVIEGVQESTYYSMNQSQDDQEKRIGTSPLTQIESIYLKADPLKVGLRKDGDRNGTNMAIQNRKVKKPQKFIKAQ